jgi:ribosomal-protein-alanine N-acetyltransferase
MSTNINFSEARLSTERLLLRPMVAADQEIIFQLRSDPEINRFIIRSLMSNRTEARAFIEEIREKMLLSQIIYWVIELKKNRQPLGSICLWNFSEDRLTAELGYTLHTFFHGKGYMQEAAEAILSFGFQELQLQQIEAFTHYDNQRSIHLLEKNNFIKKPERKDPGFDHNVIFVLTVDQWNSQKA